MALNDESSKPFVVSREQIPAARSLQEREQHVRPFALHELMARIGWRGAELSWLEAKAGQDVALRAQSRPTLLIVMRGRASLIGASLHDVEPGDVLTLAGGHEYGFSNVRSDLHVLQVQLGAEASREQDDSLTLDRLLEQNRRRAARVLETPFYRMLREQAFETSQKRAVACEAIRVFSDAFQTFLFTRQATCRDDGYGKVFHAHLMEELGHNRLLEVPGNRRVRRDAILKATSAWFSHRMLTLDNAGKAVLNMVLETSGYHFHTLAMSVFGDGEFAHYFNIHAEADESHQDLGVELLADLHPDTYRRLLAILDNAWDMMEMVTTRFAELIELETQHSRSKVSHAQEVAQVLA